MHALLLMLVLAGADHPYADGFHESLVYPDAGMSMMLYPDEYVGGPHSIVVFEALLNASGMGPNASFPDPIPEPDVEWWAVDPLGADGYSTHTFTATGMPVRVATPFCPQGNFEIVDREVEESITFSGTNQYYLSADPGPADMNDGDFSVCTLFKTTSVAAILPASQREDASGAGEGWSILLQSGQAFLQVEDHDGNVVQAAYNNSPVADGVWHVFCGTSDFSGNLTAYLDAAVDATAAGPGTVQAPQVAMSIGASADGVRDFDGQIAVVVVDLGIVWTQANITTITQYLLGGANEAWTGWDAAPSLITDADILWRGDDPTGANGDTTHAFTATGTPTAYTDDGLTASPDCLTVQDLDGDDYYLSDVTDIASPASADFSFCALFNHSDDGTSDYIATSRETATGEGWSVFAGATAITFGVENHAGAQINATYNTLDLTDNTWHVICGTHDFDGNVVAYGDGDADGTGASPGGTIEPVAKMSIGSGITGQSPWDGEIGFVVFDKGVVWTQANINTITAYLLAGVNDAFEGWANAPTLITDSDVIWAGWQPTTPGDATTHAFTATGAPMPYARNGLCATNCMVAQRFDGASYYTSTSAGLAALNSNDMTVCALFANTGTGSTYIADTSEGGNGEGWRMWTGIDTRFFVENHAGSVVTGQNLGASHNQWALNCGQFDYDGRIEAFVNGALEFGAASLGGTISTAAGLRIGALNNGTAKTTGDLVALHWWNSLLTDAQLLLLAQNWQGILSTQGDSPTYTSTGPTCCFVGEKIECFSDDFARIGCTIPPGVAGTGKPVTGYYAGPSLTNSIPYSRDLSTGWSIGAGTPDATCDLAANLFRDGRTVCSVTDDDVGNSEYIQQTFTHGLSNGDDVQICAYVRSDDLAQIDFQFRENTGGGCTPVSYEVDPVDVTTEWTQVETTHTMVDATNCSKLVVRWGMGSIFTTAANVGTVEIIVQVYLDQDWCPGTYIETEAAAVTAGADFLFYSGPSGSFPPITDGSGNLTGGYVVSVDWAPHFSDNTVAEDYILTLSNGGSAQRWALLNQPGSDVYKVFVNPGSAYRLTSSAQSLSAGVTVALEFSFNYDSDQFALAIDGVEDVTDTTATTSPTGVDEFAIGVKEDGSGQMSQGASISNVRITR